LSVTVARYEPDDSFDIFTVQAALPGCQIDIVTDPARLSAGLAVIVIVLPRRGVDVEVVIANEII
jgi:hypothetical protein